MRNKHREARPSAVAKPRPEFAPVTMQFFSLILVSISSGLNFFECSLQRIIGWKCEVDIHMNLNAPPPSTVQLPSHTQKKETKFLIESLGYAGTLRINYEVETIIVMCNTY